MDREVRYCTTQDGVRIAYCVEGEGPPILVVPGLESFSLDHLVPAKQDFFNRLAERYTIIRYDLRGVGLSERNPPRIDVATLASEGDTVVAAAGVDQYALFGYLVGGPPAVEWAVRQSSAVTHLILFESLASIGRLFSHEVAESVAAMVRQTEDVAFAAQWFTNEETRLKYPDQAEGIARAIQESVSAEIYAQMTLAYQPLDVAPVLSQVTVPTLVLHRKDDRIFTPALGRELAAGIPNAVLRLLDGSSNHYALEDPESVLSAINAFILGTEHRTAARTRAPFDERPFRTVLFTDVVENTALLRRIGDDGWRVVMREHEEIVRAALKEHGGTEISTSGDGFFASFGSSVRALQCAVEVQRALARRNNTAEHPVEVRIGLNAGEPIEEGKDVLGTAVTMAARIMSQAGSGEILASDVLRQLVAGKGFLFADRGEFVAKGFEEPVRVYEVRWRE
jgi:class 3 adenylate cyclase